MNRHIRRPSLHAALLILLLAIASPLRADICAFDQRPGATVLIPYFELSPDASVTTLFWVRNTDTRPRLVRVHLWSDQSVPVFSFNVYLPAYGTQRINMADILIAGFLPSTGPAVTPIGDMDSLGTQIEYPNCNAGTDPDDGAPIYRQLSVNVRAELMARLSGQASSQSGACYGMNHGDAMARGYVTVDVVNVCDILSPDQPGYFVDGGFGIAANDNVLLGGVEYVDALNNFAQGSQAPVLEADQNLFVPGDRTFYGRLHNYSAKDSREPLPSAWLVDFDNIGDDSAELLIWRAVPPVFEYACGTLPFPFPLADNERAPFDVDGDTPPPWPLFPPPSQTYMPASALRFPVQHINTTLDGDSPGQGSAWLNLNTTFPPPNPSDGVDGQSWVGVLHSSEGRFSELTVGQALDSGCRAGTQSTANTSGPIVENPNKPGFLFQDGLEGP
ncbi:MAG: hypothetical protein R3F22_02195 [Lysobacteraceae bacterium]